MAITISCSRCRKRYHLHDDRAGKRVKCKVCGELMRVPGQVPEEAPVVGEDRPKKVPRAVGSLIFHCPRCGHYYSVGAKWAGKRVRCKECRAKVEIPGLGDRSHDNGAREPSGGPRGSDVGLDDLFVEGVGVAGLPNPGGRSGRGGAKGRGTRLWPWGLAALGVLAVAIAIIVGVPWAGRLEGRAGGTSSPSVETLREEGVELASPPGVVPKVAIAFEGEVPRLVFAPAAPAVVLGYGPGRSEFWDLRAGEKTGTFEGLASSGGTTRLSPDGKVMLFAPPDADSVKVWSRTGVVVRGFLTPFGRAGRIELAAFAGPDRLVVASSGERSLVQVLDLATGATVREAEIQVSERRAAVSPDGTRLAVLSDDGGIVFDLATGTPTGKRLASPAGKGALASCQGVCFSPDGMELAAYTASFGEVRILCWDLAGGAIVLDRSGLSKTAPNAAESLAWLPDGESLLVRGRMLFERHDGRLVFVLKTPLDESAAVGILDRETLLAAGVRNGVRGLYAVTVPWTRIESSIEASESEDPAPLRPGMTVSLQGLGGDDPPEDSKWVEERLLEGLDLHLGADQPTVLTLRIRAAGREHGLALEVGWKQEGAEKPLWNAVVEMAPGQPAAADLDDEARRTARQALRSKLERCVLPYYLPQAPAAGLTKLPYVCELPAG